MLSMTTNFGLWRNFHGLVLVTCSEGTKHSDPQSANNYAIRKVQPRTTRTTGKLRGRGPNAQGQLCPSTHLCIQPVYEQGDKCVPSELHPPTELTISRFARSTWQFRHSFGPRCPATTIKLRLLNRRLVMKAIEGKNCTPYKWDRQNTFRRK